MRRNSALMKAVRNTLTSSPFCIYRLRCFALRPAMYGPLQNSVSITQLHDHIQQQVNGETHRLSPLDDAQRLASLKLLSNALDKKVDLLDKIANLRTKEKGLAEANPLIFIVIL